MDMGFADMRQIHIRIRVLDFLNGFNEFAQYTAPSISCHKFLERLSKRIRKDLYCVENEMSNNTYDCQSQCTQVSHHHPH